MKYVYKIIAAIGALATIPMLIFSKIFYFKASSIAAMALVGIGQLLGNEEALEILEKNNGQIPENIGQAFSVYDIASLAESFKGLFSSAGESSDKLQPVVNPAITMVVIMACLIIVAIVTAVLAIVVKNNRKVIYSSVVGIVLSCMLTYAFDALAAPLLDGTVSLSSVTESFWASLIGQLEVLDFTTMFWFIPVIFGGIILWTVLYNYTLPEEEKKERKRMLGEVDDE